MTPPYIVHIDDVPEQEGAYPPPFDREKLSLYKNLGQATGSRNLGFAVERLRPGRRTSFTHAHSQEEEIIYVLAGICHVRLVEPGEAPRELLLRAGHAASFAGTRIAHTFVNRGSEDCLLVIVGERRPDDDRVFYPDDPEYDAAHARIAPENHWSP